MTDARNVDKVDAIEIKGNIYEVGRYYRPHWPPEAARDIVAQWAIWKLTMIQRETVAGDFVRYTGRMLPIYQIFDQRSYGSHNSVYVPILSSWEPLDLTALLYARARFDEFIRNVARECGEDGAK